MKIKRIISLVIAVGLLISCSGCSLNLFSVESLLSPPVQDGENGEIQKAFNELMKDKVIQLKTPVSGDYQSSFVLYDLNGDKIDEAMVFYSDSSVDGSVRMCLLESCNDDEWTLVADVKGAGSGVSDISFNDLDGNGTDEIFVSWSLYDSKTTKIVSIYESVKGRGGSVLESLGNEYCNSKSFADFNGDLKNDLVLIYLDDSAAVQKSFLRLFSLSAKNELVKYAEVQLDSAITSIAAITHDVIRDDGKPYSRLFLDCNKNDRTIFTEMVYWDEEKSSPVKALEEPSVTTARSANVLCRDIDSDGNIEIPVVAKLDGDEKQLSVTDYDLVYTFTLLEWKNEKGDKSEIDVITLLNPLDMYIFDFPWNGEITVKYDSTRKALLFVEWSESENSFGEELFSIAYREGKSKNKYGALISEDDDGAYYYRITEHGKDFGITEKTIKNSFTKIS